MKESKIRLTLILLALFPPLVLCGMVALNSLLSLLARGDITAIPFIVTFGAALGIFGYFVKDTLKLYKDGK